MPEDKGDRTVCACAKCAEFCTHQPGYLVPDDVGRIAEFLGIAPGELVRNHLTAGLGIAFVRTDCRGQAQALRAATLIPLKRPDGSCHWHSPDGALIAYPEGKPPECGSCGKSYPEGVTLGSFCTGCQKPWRCGVHPVAPFGCRMFDEHQDGADAEHRRSWGLAQINYDATGKYKWWAERKAGR